MARKTDTQNKKRRKSRGADNATKTLPGAVPAQAGRGHSFRATALEWAKNIAIAVLLALVIRWSLVEPYRIPSGSMRPTLMEGDRLFVNKLAYGLRWPFMNKRIFDWKEPQRWDVVVFKSVEDNPEHGTLVKRIVGMPGERVHIENGEVSVNGIPLTRPEDLEEVYYESFDEVPRQFSPYRDFVYGILTDEAHAVVPDDHYFLLGDNSAHSSDGRRFGWVPRDHLLGPVFSIWWPPSRWRDFTGFTQTWWWRGGFLIIALLAVGRLFLWRFWQVHPGESDELREGEHLVVVPAAFGLPLPFTRRRLTQGRKPERGDLVLYYGPPGSANRNRLHLGRVAALPDETVSFVDGKLHINNEPLEAPAPLAERSYAADGTDGARYGVAQTKELSRVPKGHYYLLGNAIDGTMDSRAMGWIPENALVGPAKFVCWPPHRVRPL